MKQGWVVPGQGYGFDKLHLHTHLAPGCRKGLMSFTARTTCVHSSWLSRNTQFDAGISKQPANHHKGSVMLQKSW